MTGAPGQASITGNYPARRSRTLRRRAARSERSTRFRRRTAVESCSSVTTAITGDYARDAAYQRTQIDANGNPVLEPAYGILNARFVYEPSARNYSVEIWGKNLLDELYINGGFDTRDTWGYDFSIVGRSREIGGISLGFSFDRSPRAPQIGARNKGRLRPPLLLWAPLN